MTFSFSTAEGTNKDLVYCISSSPFVIPVLDYSAERSLVMRVVSAWTVLIMNRPKKKCKSICFSEHVALRRNETLLKMR